jgi:LPXTG-motif cell wall-anchored protein
MSLLMWALITMIKSLNTGENWRIVFSIIGFVGFLALTSLFVYAIIKKMKEEKIE